MNQEERAIIHRADSDIVEAPEQFPDASRFVETPAKLRDTDLLINHPCEVCLGGDVVAAYDTLPMNHEGLLARVRGLSFRENIGPGRTPSKSLLFGYLPNDERGELNSMSPAVYAYLSVYSRAIQDLLRKNVVEQYQLQLLAAKGIDLGKRLTGGIFTTGVLHKNYEGQYHLDSGSIPGTWTAALCLRDESEGGFLSIPQLGIAFEMAHGMVAFFDGGRFAHGVTAISKSKDSAARYSVIFHTRKGLRESCG